MTQVWIQTPQGVTNVSQEVWPTSCPLSSKAHCNWPSWGMVVSLAFPWLVWNINLGAVPCNSWLLLMGLKVCLKQMFGLLPCWPAQGTFKSELRQALYTNNKVLPELKELLKQVPWVDGTSLEELWKTNGAGNSIYYTWHLWYYNGERATEHSINWIINGKPGLAAR